MLPDWIAAHVRAFAYFGGVARQTVSDNLKAGNEQGADRGVEFGQREEAPMPEPIEIFIAENGSPAIA